MQIITSDMNGVRDNGRDGEVQDGEFLLQTTHTRLNRLMVMSSLLSVSSQYKHTAHGISHVPQIWKIRIKCTIWETCPRDDQGLG